jgi:sulfite exporter TauE/SafE/copper chaperone CopZ
VDICLSTSKKGSPFAMRAHGVSLRTKGMHCPGCEHIIEDAVHQLPGIERVKADYATEAVSILFDPSATSLDEICAAIERKGYRCFRPEETIKPPSRLKRLAAFLLGLAGIILIIWLDTEVISGSGVPDATEHMSYGLILVLGLLTGFHCVGMCGGFVLSYSANSAQLGQPSYLAHVLYGSGKTLSYTVIGAAFGLLGAIITFTPFLRGMAGVFAGAFLIIFGLNMLGFLAPLRRLHMKIPAPLARSIDKKAHANTGPFTIGLLNGLMIACGPLQAMYVMAAGTGSAIEGAQMLFTFGIGTLPVLLSFGVLTTMISGALTHRLLRASGVVVVILGAVMINRGLILIGAGHDLRSMITTVSDALSPPPEPPATSAAVQTITMDVVRTGYTPNHFVLRDGVPVKWVINGKEITNCNKRIVVPSLGLEFDVIKGEQTIEFTPTRPGIIPWSCWMGMLHGDFVVVGDGTAVADASAKSETPNKAEALTTPEAPAELEAAPEPKSSVTPVEPLSPEPAAPPPVVSAPEAPVAKAPEMPLAAAPTPSAPEMVETYKIVAGDRLATIATALYGDPKVWRAIAKANPGLNPRKLRPGQVIKLPKPVAKEKVGAPS